jgi:hypothetical protein
VEGTSSASELRFTALFYMEHQLSAQAVNLNSIKHIGGGSKSCQGPPNRAPQSNYLYKQVISEKVDKSTPVSPSETLII